MTHSLVLTIFKKKTGVGGSWLKYLLLIPLMLLTIPFVFCLFHKIIISCIPSRWLSIHRKWWLDLKQLIKCIVWYMINDCNSVTLEGNCNPLQYSCLENSMDGRAWKAIQPMGSWRVGHDWASSLSLFTFMHWRKKWQPTPVFLSGESQGRGSLMGFRVWGRTEPDTTEPT